MEDDLVINENEEKIIKQYNVVIKTMKDIYDLSKNQDPIDFNYDEKNNDQICIISSLIT